MAYCNYLIPSVKNFNFTFPFFTSQNSQDLCILVPISRPAAHKIFYPKSPQRIVANDFTEEEILPDFRCKICSISVLTYTDFKCHMTTHGVKMDFSKEDEVKLSSVRKNNLVPQFKSYPAVGRSVDVTEEVQPKVVCATSVPTACISALFQMPPQRLVADTVTEEEILPEFRCKICSIRVSNYSEFEFHLASHRMKTDASQVANQKVLTVIKSKSNSKLKSHLAMRNVKKKGGQRAKLKVACVTKSSPISTFESHLANHYIAKIDPTIRGTKLPVTSTVNPLLATCHCKNEVFLLTPLQSTSFQDVDMIKSSPGPAAKHTNKISMLTPLKEVVHAGSIARNIPISSVLKPENKVPICMPLQSDVFQNAGVTNCSSVLPVDYRKGELSKPELIIKEALEDASYTKTCQVLPAEEHKNRISIVKELQSEVYQEIKTTKGNVDAPVSFEEEANDKMASKLSQNGIYQDANVTANSRVSSAKKCKNKISILAPLRNEIFRDTSEINSSPGSRIEVQQEDVPAPTPKQSLIFKCPYCPENFKSRVLLSEHVLQHDIKEDIACVMCGSIFACISSLRKHMKMYHCKNKDRRHCPHCSYKCFQNSDLIKHISRRHTRNFKYKCVHCIKGFATPKELSNHENLKHFEKLLWNIPKST